MKVALVHDQISEFGGAERVLLVLHEMFPEAPIYTAFVREGSQAAERFRNADLRPSWAQSIPWYSSKLYSPLRFLLPLVWESFDFRTYDLVISSDGWSMCKGILTGTRTVHISYIHTPPRYLYGYPTSIDWQKYWPVRLYARLVNHYLREYDFAAAQRPDVLVANSENVRRRIQKFYRRDAQVVYPPVELARQRQSSSVDDSRKPPYETGFATATDKQYFLIVSRVVGGKGLKLAVQACTQLELPLKVVGSPAGWSTEFKQIQEIAGLARRPARPSFSGGGSSGEGGPTIEFLGYVGDEELASLYTGAKAFLATAQDEDFGMTVVEAQLAGTPVIAFRGGGYLEAVIEGKTGVFFDEYSVRGLKRGISDFLAKPDLASRDNFQTIASNAKRFSKQKFVQEMKNVISHAVSQTSG